MFYHFWKKYAPFLVYLAVMLLAISDTGVQMLILNTVGAHSRILRKIAICLLFLKVLGTRYTKKEFFILFPITIISLYNYTICANNYCIWNILMIASMKDLDYTRFFKVLFYSSLFSMIFVGILSFMGIGGPISLSEVFGRGKVETRYCFGMYHPNIWHFAVARCIIFFVIAYAAYLNWKTLTTLMLLNTIAYFFSASRTGFIATTLFLLLIALYKYCEKLMNSKIVKLSLSGGLISIFLIYSYYLVDYQKTWNTTAIWISQNLTTGRLTQVALYLKKFPIKLWGTRFPDDGTVVDCGFFRMLSEYGWILGGIFIIGFLLLLYHSLKNNRYEITAVCVFYALYSLFESYLTSRPSYNIIVFFMALLLFQGKSFSFKSDDNIQTKSSSFK